jgi:hypothetical protein
LLREEDYQLEPSIPQNVFYADRYKNSCNDFEVKRLMLLTIDQLKLIVKLKMTSAGRTRSTTKLTKIPLVNFIFGMNVDFVRVRFDNTISSQKLELVRRFQTNPERVPELDYNKVVKIGNVVLSLTDFNSVTMPSTNVTVKAMDAVLLMFRLRDQALFDVHEQNNEHTRWYEPRTRCIFVLPSAVDDLLNNERSSVQRTDIILETGVNFDSKCTSVYMCTRIDEEWIVIIGDVKSERVNIYAPRYIDANNVLKCNTSDAVYKERLNKIHNAVQLAIHESKERKGMTLNIGPAFAIIPDDTLYATREITWCRVRSLSDSAIFVFVQLEFFYHSTGVAFDVADVEKIIRPNMGQYLLDEMLPQFYPV